MTVQEEMNGNRQAILSVRDSIRQGRSIDNDTRDDLLFTAIVDIYDQITKNTGRLDSLTTKNAPMELFYRVGVWVAGLVGVGIVAFIGGLLTHTIEIVHP